MLTGNILEWLFAWISSEVVNSTSHFHLLKVIDGHDCNKLLVLQTEARQKNKFTFLADMFAKVGGGREGGIVKNSQMLIMPDF